MMKYFLMLIVALLVHGCAFAPGEKSSSFEYRELRALEKDWGYTQAVKHGKTIYLAGSVSMDKDGHVIGAGDMAVQLKNALEDVRKTLALYGANPGNIVKETIYTTDMDALIAAYDVRADFYKGYRFPPSSWLGVNRLGLAGTVVEIEVVAELD